MVDRRTQIRLPYGNDETLHWHRAAMRGDRPDVHLDYPQCGWFRTRLVRGGPYVPARIWWDQQIDDGGQLLATPVLRCEIDGRSREPVQAWSWLANKPISEEEYESMLSGRMENVEEKSASPSEATDWNEIKPPF